jgi:N-acetyl sugar amidotransferase
MTESIFERGNLERQLTELPKEIKFCKKCVMSNQRPKIVFDDEGICSACRFAEYKNNVIDWEDRERQLLELLDRHRRNDGYWDVVVPSSGGKDSGFVAYMLKHKYGMHPLTVTWSPLIYTDIGWQNFQNFSKSGFTNLLATPNGVIHRKLARLSFEELGDPFHVFVLGQVAYPLHMAIKFGINLVFSGEDGAAEYGSGMLTERDSVEFSRLTGHQFKGCSFDELIGYGLQYKDYLSEEDLDPAELAFYKPPSVEELEQAGIRRRHFFSYYHKWNPQENYYYSSEHLGFQPNPERSEGTYSKYSSLDDRTDGIHYYMAYIKFGYGRATYDASQEIRTGHITREEGVALVRRYDGEFPQKYFKECLEYMDITEEHFWAVADSYRSSHIWERVKGEWKLKHQVS